MSTEAHDEEQIWPFAALFVVDVNAVGVDGWHTKDPPRRDGPGRIVEEVRPGL